jgi:hypothetical protein
MAVLWVWNEYNFGEFLDSGEISKYQNMIKNFNEVVKSFAREISYRS